MDINCLVSRNITEDFLVRCWVLYDSSPIGAFFSQMSCMNLYRLSVTDTWNKTKNKKMCWRVTRKCGSSMYFVGRGVEDSLVVSPKLTQWRHRQRSNLVHGRKRLRNLERKRGKRHLERKKHSNFSSLESITHLSTFPVTLVQRLNSRWTHVRPLRLL